MKIIKLIFLVLMTISSTDAKAAQLKSVVVDGYSNPFILILSDGVKATDISEIRLHLHGWTQDPKSGNPFNSQYDFAWKDPKKAPSTADLQHFVDAFEMNTEVETNPKRAILIPVSRGHCDQYPELLKNLDQVSEKVLQQFGISLETAPIVHVSAHSGGGLVLSQLILQYENSVFKKLKRVTFYDAVYSTVTEKRLLEWIQKANPSHTRILEMIVIAGGVPAVRSSTLLASIVTPVVMKEKNINGIKTSTRQKISAIANVVQEFTESGSAKTLDHWSIVRGFWKF